MNSEKVTETPFNRGLWKGNVPVKRLDRMYGTPEHMEEYARDIDVRVLLLQALIRGYMTRQNFPLALSKRNGKARKFDKGVDSFRLEAHRHRVKKAYSDTDRSVRNDVHDGSSELSCGSDTSAKPDLLGGSSQDIDNSTNYLVDDEAKSLDDSFFVNRKVIELPDGWSLSWSALSDPCFLDNKTGETTRLHPRQSDATKAYGKWFDLAAAWKHVGNTPAQQQENASGVSQLTIELLALEYQAKHLPAWNGPQLDTVIKSSRSDGIAGYWVEQPDSSQTNSLCAVCSHIDFRFMMTWDCYNVEKSRFYIKPLQAVLQEMGCSFCRMVAECAAQELPPDLLKKVPVNSEVIRCALSHNKDNVAPMSIEFECANDQMQKIQEARFHRILANNDVPPEDEPEGFSVLRKWRAIEDRVNITTINAFLEESNWHWDQCKTEKLPVPISNPSHKMQADIKSNDTTMMVIDVQMECLVDITPPRYIALSYVWGGPQLYTNVRENTNKLHEQQALRNGEPLPRTIRDAIDFVKLLGEQYLWVDSLCIIQDDEEHKAAQIANMANVYRQAYFTIVAAYGSSADAGLPGVGDSTRRCQIRADVQGLTLATTLPYFEHAVQDSVWNTRGWTYQESELCSRYVIFTKYQLYFRYAGAIYTESQKLMQYGASRVYDVRTSGQPNFLSYWDATKHYTKRILGKDGDIENAFQGIAALLQPLFRSRFLFGLPESELDTALLWRPATSSIPRRTGFPSWSWCGWSGPVQYLWWSNHIQDDASRIQWQDAETHEFFTSNDFRADRRAEIPTEEKWEEGRERERFRYDMPYWYQESNPELKFLHPTAPQEQRISRSFLKSGSHELRFKALSAHFNLRMPSGSVVGPVFKRIIDKDGFSAGFVHLNYAMDPSELPPLIPTGGGATFPPGPPSYELRCFPEDPALELVPPPPLLTKDNSADSAFFRRDSQVVEFICLSRRRSCEWDSMCDMGFHTDLKKPPGIFEDQGDVSHHATLYPDQNDVREDLDHFDYRRYNVHMSFPLYNAMAIERKAGDDGVAERIGIGVIHVTAFWQANPEWKYIVLG